MSWILQTIVNLYVDFVDMSILILGLASLECLNISCYLGTPITLVFLIAVTYVHDPVHSWVKEKKKNSE